MPSRRTTLLGLGVLAAGGVGAVGTGAFSAATAEREVSASFASDDTEALLAFQPTSAYAELDGSSDGQLVISFDDLNRNANFVFEDTFIILNNGTEEVTLESVSSGAGNTQWRSESDDAPGNVLIADGVNSWQGDPNEEFINSNEVDAEVDENVDAGHIGAGELENTTIALGPRGSDGDLGDWVSVGFEFGQDDAGVGNWDPENDIPGAVQFEFGQNNQ